ncbi:MAG: penicillin-binding protein 2 [Candidatus Firestonebacteria bacterium]|nr:penicillin-binding protein 2 [Candidatus Firestonebacteria bacterium]
MEEFERYQKQVNLKNRLIIFTLVIHSLIVLIIIRLWFLQIIKYDYYQKLSLENRTRFVTIEASRGLFVDRNNHLLVGNRPAYSIAVIPEDIKDDKEIIIKLSNLLNISQIEIKNKINKNKQGPFYPIHLKYDAGEDVISVIEEDKENYPGTIIIIEPCREYIKEEFGAHFLGYLGEINDRELKMSKYKNYCQGNIIGKTGLETTYEEYLRGKEGKRKIEVNARGQQLSSNIAEEPVSGYNIILSIDRDLQEIADKAMENKNGAIIAIDPGNGEILAMVSKPDFDLNIFSGQVSPDEWEELNTNPLHPLINRVITGAYPPGSTFKIITAIAALEEGIITPQNTEICNGEFTYGNMVYKCWKKEGHGEVNITEALIHSCNIFFYKLGSKTGIKRIEKYASLFGLGKKTGVDLEQEKSGLVPNPKWKKSVLGQPWYPGDDILTGIGQGYLLVTPLQMANLISAITNGGKLYRPHFVKKIYTESGQIIFQGKDEPVETVKISDQTERIIKDALWKCVNRNGTGRRARIPGLNVLGKTGTAQTVAKADIYDDVETSQIPEAIRPHAWFISSAPAQNPRIAVAILIEHGGDGSKVGAPIAYEMFNAYLKKEKRDYSLDRYYHPEDVPKEEHEIEHDKNFSFNTTYINQVLKSIISDEKPILSKE